MALLESAYHGYWLFVRYLKQARERLERQTYRARFEAADPRTLPEGPRAARGAWIRLTPPDQNSAQEELEPFFDQRNNRLHDTPTRTKDHIEVLARDPNRGLICVSRSPKGAMLYLHPNTYSIGRQLQALEALENRPHPEHRPLLRLAERSVDARWPSVEAILEPEWKILVSEEIAGVEQEREFVRKALGTPDFAILEGPPGSGKTITICELILQEILRGHRVLLCASTHVAVDNVIEKLKSLRWTQKLVMAIRVGDEDNVSDIARPFLVENRIATERVGLTQELEGVEQRSAAQNYFLDALRSDGLSVVASLVIDAANLICGTTIGILQHPEVLRGRDLDVTPRFDMLIVDEASKTTLQEFIVPALLSKRWVLVGDVRQLSPYVDEREIQENIVGLLGKEIREGLLPAFLAAEHAFGTGQQPILFVHDSEDVCDIAHLQSEHLGIGAVKVPILGRDQAELSLLQSDLFTVETKELRAAASLIPPDVEIIPALALPNRLSCRRAYWLAHDKRASDFVDRSSGSLAEERTWEKELAWRLIRQFEVRRDSEAARKYADSVTRLLPAWGSEDEKGFIRKEVDTLRRIAFPSVLQLLQDGFEADASTYASRGLTHGLPRDVFAARHVMLEFQHRMHSAISAFPRVQFYENNGLRDPPGVDHKRAWTCPLYRDRCVWVTVVGGAHPSQHRNAREAEALLAELRRFLAWAAQNPKFESERRIPWEIAVLAFYGNQQLELRARLQTEFDRPNLHHFDLPRVGARVVLGTVDGFQGHEADIVFLSFARNRGVGFLNSPNRMNVALTRARYQLVLVGNRPMFERNRSSAMLRELASRARDNIGYARSSSRRDR